MISGLEAVTDGQIMLDGRDVTWAHPSERDIAFVFQFFALYSHMTSRENIAFPLQAQRESKETIRQRVREVASCCVSSMCSTMRPGSLSGGDQQRVALARALVRRPGSLLDGRAVGRAGCGVPRDDARGDQAAAHRAARHDRLRHARPDRSDGDG